MLLCPRCTKPLVAMKTVDGDVSRCESCDGHVVPLAVLRKRLAPAAIEALSQRMRASERSGRPCASCSEPTVRVVVPVGAVTTAAQACGRCGLVGFEDGAFTRLPPAPHRPGPRSTTVLRSKASDDEWFVEADPWDARTLVGLPDVDGAPDSPRRPWATWTLVTTLLGVTVVAMVRGWGVGGISGVRDELHAWATAWGFVPAEPFRHGGATLLTSLFLHASWWHVLVNAYFLTMLGQAFETTFGASKLLGLVALASVLGCLAHALANVGSPAPVVGASGEVSAIFAYLAIALPQLRLRFPFWSWRLGHGTTVFEIRLPVRWAFGIWAGVELLGALFPVGNVSHAGHLGGAAAGIAWWAIETRLRRARSRGATTT